MRGAPQELFIDPSDFHVFLKAIMVGKTVAEFSEELGISREYLYMLLKKERKPSLAILKKVGLEICYRAKPPASAEKAAKP